MTKTNQTQTQGPEPSSPNEPVKLFAKREKIYPRRVSGRYRSLKWVAMIVTLGIYYLVPFLRWDRGPTAPDQAVLIDLPNRRAYWFFIEIWPQEVYYLTAILVFAAILLFFVTSLFGRVWCGYFCPQTVWTDLFVWTERLVQGDRNARKKLQEGPWTLEKIRKIGITHMIWLVIAWCTAGSFVLYFNDAPTLVRSFLEFDVSPTVLTFIAGLTFSTYIMAGFAREQVCIYMCPYARFQAAMFDRDTLIIGYDQDRGEPRGHHKKGDSWEGRGHCIDCTACVQVCPTGIDIRKGLQMECIACGLCVDACNDVMAKVGLPPGLIRYDTENNIERRRAGQPDVLKLLRPRTIYYSVVLCALFAFVVYSLVNRSLLELHVLHDRNPLYVTLSDGDIRNGYEIKILNKSHAHKSYMLDVARIDGADIAIKGPARGDSQVLEVSPDSVGNFHVFLKAPPQRISPVPVDFILTDSIDGTRVVHESIFVSK